MSAYFAQIRPASPTSDARGATERCVCACACVRACVERRCPAESGTGAHFFALERGFCLLKDITPRPKFCAGKTLGGRGR